MSKQRHFESAEKTAPGAEDESRVGPVEGAVSEAGASPLAETPAVEVQSAGPPKVPLAETHEVGHRLAPEVDARISELQAEVDRLKKPRRVASGSKARPNVKYTLLSRPPKWSDTPQVAQLEEILFGQEKRELLEPELFDLIRAGAEAGVLRTRQNPVRIFQYYRSDLIKDNVLIYK